MKQLKESTQLSPEVLEHRLKRLIKEDRMPSFSRVMRALSRARVAKSMLEGTIVPIQKSWYVVTGGKLVKMHWRFEPLLKAETKYYSPEEVKARGMRWVTIRGARVLLQGTSDGGWVVVGGAGGKLNHLRIDKILSKEEYKQKRKQLESKKRADVRALTKEEKAEQAKQRKVEIAKKKELRTAYTQDIQKIAGLTEDDLKAQISSDVMDAITDQAKKIVEGKKKRTLTTGDETDIEAEKNKLIDREAKKQVKKLERQAIETLMNDFMPEGDPNVKKRLKELMDTDKAVAILKARKEFKKNLKAVTTIEKTPARLRIGETFAADSKSLDKEVIDEIKQNLETAQNVKLYDRMNAQSQAMEKHVHTGVTQALNGLAGDVFGSGAMFSNSMVEELGVEALSRVLAIHMQQSGMAGKVKDALETFAEDRRAKLVSEAMNRSDERLKTADDLRALAEATPDDPEGLMSRAQANGYALKEIVGAQRELGSAVGSLRTMAHVINALEDPPADSVYVDVGGDLSSARRKAHRAGLKRGQYNIRTEKQGRGKRIILEIPKESLPDFFDSANKAREKESIEDRIKSHKENTGYVPPGMNPDATHPITKERGPIKLDAAQEAGLRFFRERKNVVLDFEAGLGKTAVAYAAAMEAMNNMGAKKILVVTPPKLRSQFADEASVFLDKENRKLVKGLGSYGPKKRREAYTRETGIDVIGHDTFRTDASAIKDAGYDMVIVDEIHEMTPQGTTISAGSGRFRGMMEVRDAIPMKIGMSGTNIKNSKTELWQKINFVDPNHTLGTVKEFENRYKGLNQGTSAFAESSNEAFRKEIAPWVYSQRNNLPVEHTQQRLRVNLTPKQRENLRQVMDTYRKEKEAGRVGAAARRDAAMYRIVHDDAMAANSKAGEIVRIMKEKHAGEKAAIHVTGVQALNSTKARLENEFGTGTVVVIQGEGPNSKPDHIRKAKAAFNDPDNPVKFILGTSSMEAGHNLQGGTVNFHLDQPMTYAALDQRNKRTYRKGQKNNVNSYVLSGVNPYDLRMEDMIGRKQRESAIMGNPQAVEGMDGSGFLAYLNRVEQGVSRAEQVVA